MMHNAKLVDESLLRLLEECADIQPPLTNSEIVEVFLEKLAIDAKESITSSLKRLSSNGAIVKDGNRFMLAETKAA